MPVVACAMTDSYADRLVDEGALREYLDDALGAAEAFSVRRHQAGHSNETLFVTWGDDEYVLRRPPAGETADKAHDVLREYRVMDALQETPVPLPETVLGCEDESVIGAEFFLMERLDGDVVRDAEPPRFGTPEYRQRVGEELVDGLSAIHDVDVDAVGLGDFGHPEGFAQRQVERWSQQLMWAFDTTAAEREVETLYDVMAWLQDNAPETHPHALVHGDYKLDNVMFAPGTPPELVGVFDWEMSTLGDPRTDLGWLLAFWRDADDDGEIDAESFRPAFVANADYPTRRDLVARWEDATGLEYEHDRFYRALAVYKLAGLGEMFFARHLQGDADDPLYPKMRETVPALADRAHRIVDGDAPL
jgi:aminoglycoside phosphotransferase (APT) family kinase protein